MLADGTFPLGYRADGQVADRMPERERREFGGREHILELGPDDIHLPGVFVDKVLLKSELSPRKPAMAEFSS